MVTIRAVLKVGNVTKHKTAPETSRTMVILGTIEMLTRARACNAWRGAPFAGHGGQMLKVVDVHYTCWGRQPAQIVSMWCCKYRLLPNGALDINNINAARACVAEPYDQYNEYDPFYWEPSMLEARRIIKTMFRIPHNVEPMSYLRYFQT